MDSKNDAGASASDTTPGPTKACPYCGETILAVAIKCKHCRSDLTVSPPIGDDHGAVPAPPSTSSAPSSASNAPIIAGLVVIVVVVVGGIYFYDKSREYRYTAITTEAIDELDKIYKGAAIYYTTPHVDSWGRRLPCQFPVSQAITPIEGTCCGSRGGPDADNDDRCDPSPTTLESAAWAALGFKMLDQHYYTYAFESYGSGPHARFTASAYGDLDCDGVMSTFQRIGFGDPMSTNTECALQGSAAFYVKNEIE